MITSADQLLAKVWGDIQRMDLEIETKQARKNPREHRMTRVFSDGLNYRFWTAKDARKRTVRFCYSVNRNVAGYYLGWTETLFKSGKVTRTEWHAQKSKKDIMDAALRRCRKMKGAS